MAVVLKVEMRSAFGISETVGSFGFCCRTYLQTGASCIPGHPEPSLPQALKFAQPEPSAPQVCTVSCQAPRFRMPLMSTKEPCLYAWQVQLANLPLTTSPSVLRTQGSAGFLGFLPVGVGGPEKKQRANGVSLQYSRFVVLSTTFALAGPCFVVQQSVG